MKRLNVLLFIDQNLNLKDSPSQWLSTLANIVTSDDKIEVSILLKTPIRKKEVKYNITNDPYVKWIRQIGRAHV